MNTGRTLFPALALAAAFGAALVVTGPATAQTATSHDRQTHDQDHHGRYEKGEKGERGEKTAAAAKVGEKAPDFTLKDAKGKEYHLADYKGRIVVLQWINTKCPVCNRVAETGVSRKMHSDLKAMDPNIVYLAIDSSYYLEPETTAAYLEKNKVEAPALLDADGTVGHLYGARTTPDLFVIDAEGILRYSGAIDDDPRGSKGDEAMNYVVNAVRQIKAGETVAPDTTRSYGCSVKYKK